MGTKKNANHKVVRKWVYEEGARTQGPFEALRSESTMGDRTKGAWPPTDILNAFLFGTHLAAQAPAGNVGAHHCTRPRIIALAACVYSFGRCVLVCARRPAQSGRMQAPAPATAKFQLALPYILGPVSQGLAALHASRAYRLHPSDPTLRTTHCPACGAGYVDGGGQYRSVRRKGKREHAKREDRTLLKRSLHMSCGVCGHCEELPIDEDGASSFLQARKRRKVATSDADIAVRRTSPLAAKSGEAAHAPPEPMPAGRSVTDVRHNLPTPSPVRSSATPPMGSETRRDGRSNASVVPTSSSRSKSRSKKSGGLQNLLARNREKQEQEKRSAGNPSGLAAFLQDLG